MVWLEPVTLLVKWFLLFFNFKWFTVTCRNFRFNIILLWVLRCLRKRLIRLLIIVRSCMDWFIILRLNLCSINRCWLVYWLVNRLLWYIIVLRVDWLLWDLLTIIIILMLIEIRRLSLIRTHWCRYIAIKSIEHRSFLII